MGISVGMDFFSGECKLGKAVRGGDCDGRGLADGDGKGGRLSEIYVFGDLCGFCFSGIGGSDSVKNRRGQAVWQQNQGISERPGHFGL